MRFALLLVLLAIKSLWLHSSSSVGCFADEPSTLDRHYVAGDFRIFFTTEGKSAVPSEDRDASGTPDRVEDIAKQLTAARKMYCGVLQFTDPINCERYSGTNCIQVSIRERSEFNIGNGLAFEESQRAKRIPGGNASDRALVIAIGNHIDPTTNITPAREFFHLIQYASTYFKNRWFLEGQARWSERALKPGGVGEFRYPPNGPWPQNPQQLSQLAEMDYDAEFVLWNPIAQATDRKGIVPRTPEIRDIAAMRYSNGKPVLSDVMLNGAKIMREILDALGDLDDVAFEALGYEKWTEENQRSAKNDPFVYQAVMDTLRKYNRRVGPFSAR